MHASLPMKTAPVAATNSGTDGFLAAFDGFEREHATSGAAWLTPLRQSAIARFAELGFPTLQHEDWRCTDVAPLAKTAFVPAARPAQPVTLFDLAPYLLGAFTGHRLVFINGEYVPALSRVGDLPAGCTVESLAQMLDNDPAALEPLLARYASFQDQPFTALNTAFLRNGTYIRINPFTCYTSPCPVDHPRSRTRVTWSSSARAARRRSSRAM